jgi:hypothetical protein
MPSEFQETIYDEEWNIVGIKKYFPSAPSEPEPESDAIVYLSPSFELGASSADPSLGSGGALAWYTREEFNNGARINLDIYLNNVGGDAGVGTGSYELYLPDELEPAKDIYSGHANLWVGGGGISEFDGSVKWTMRNATKGPKLIFTFGGVEWDGLNPKNWANFKLRASIRYFL